MLSSPLFIVNNFINYHQFLHFIIDFFVCYDYNMSETVCYIKSFFHYICETFFI